MMPQQEVGIRRRVGAAWAALKGGKPLAATGGGGWDGGPYGTVSGSLWGYRPGSQRRPAEDAGDPLLCSVFSIAYGWILRNFPEPRLRVVRTTTDAEGNAQQRPVPEHPLVQLLARPNPDYDGATLWAGTIYSYLRGNAFWYKARAGKGHGAVRELYYVPHWEMRPIRNSQGSITAWQHTVNGRQEEEPWPTADVVHFRNGIDPYRPGMGWDQLQAVLPEIAVLNEGSEYVRAILTNMGVPGVLVTPKVGEKITPEQAKTLRDRFVERFRGSKRGEPLAASLPVDFVFPDASPQKMALGTLLDRPEDRVCAALGLTAMVLGLTAGANAKTYANLQEARRGAYHDCLIPMQGHMGQVMEFDLLPELGQARGETVGWDYSEVSVLQEDRNQKAKRVVALVQGGVLTPNEGRAEWGVKPLTGKPEYDELAAVTKPDPAQVAKDEAGLDDGGKGGAA